MEMKLLTLNTHSLIEEHYQQKLNQFVKIILEELPDVIALQEVNQSVNAPLADQALLEGYFPCENNSVPIRSDNHAANAARLLRESGISCSWTWLPAKLGYGKYDEGMALFSLHAPIKAVDSFRISGCSDYLNWKTRKTLGIRIDGYNGWFYTVHMGWWDDREEPFSSQWESLESCLKVRKQNGPVWLLGDFNSPSEVRNQGYDFICAHGWQDTYLLAEEKDNGITVEGVIDGWRDHSNTGTAVPDGMRIDHIWCSQKIPIVSSRVIFNRTNGPVVSDHFGVQIQTADH